MLRDGSTHEDASARLNSQLPITTKVEYADLVIDNSGSRAELDQQVVAFVQKMNNSVGMFRWLLSWFIPPIGITLAIWSLTKRHFTFRKRKADGLMSFVCQCLCICDLDYLCRCNNLSLVHPPIINV
jgi:dephospho-CoA kinase